MIGTKWLGVHKTEIDILGRSAACHPTTTGNRHDGYDTIEWIAAQPWSNAKVGMSGRSAAGINSNLAASAAPPHLTCVYIVTASETLFDESYFMGGVFREHFRGNFMRLQGVEDQIPIMKARAILDEQWKRTDMIHHRDKVNVPMYQVGGWLDMFAKGAIGNFVYLHPCSDTASFASACASSTSSSPSVSESSRCSRSSTTM